MQAPRVLHTTLTLALLGVAPTFADVITVDPDGGADFDDLQLAIDAAQDGDILRLGSGIYTTGTPSRFIIDNKGLAIVGAENPLPRFWDGFEIENLAAEKRVILSNLDYDFEGLEITNCAGAVRIQDLTLVRDAMVTGSANVVFKNSMLRGRTGDEGGNPGHGLVIDGSNVAVYSCMLIGGDADQFPAILFADAQDGGHGALVLGGSFAYFADSTLDGGDGGNSHVGDFLDPPVNGGDGGNGLRVEHGDAVVFDSPRTGGEAGEGGECSVLFPGCGPPGADGQPGAATFVSAGPDPATLDEIAGNARSAEIETWVENTNEINVTFHGEENDLVYLPAQPQPDFFYDPIWKGVWAQPSSAVQPVGTIPPSGMLNVTVQLPANVTCDAAEHYLQAAFLAPLGGGMFDRFIGTPVALISFTPTADYPTTCSSNPNSTGLVAQVTGSGNPDVNANDLSLSVTQLPLNRFGYFLMADTQGFIPLFGGSQGNLCLGAPLIRFAANVLNSGATGSVAFQPDFNNLPNGAVFSPGDTWYFQYWYRDQNPGNTSNTSAALIVSFCP